MAENLGGVRDDGWDWVKILAAVGDKLFAILASGIVIRYS